MLATQLDPPSPVTVQSYVRTTSLSGTSAGFVSGACQGNLIYLPTMTVTRLFHYSVVASVGATHSFMALYQITVPSASTHVLLGQTADAGAVEIPATTLNSLALQTPVSVQAGLFYIAISTTFVTSCQTIAGYNPVTHNLKNLHPIGFIGGTSTGGGATAPATLANGTVNGAPYWVGAA